MLAVVDADTVKEAIEDGMTETQLTAKASRITRVEALAITAACTAAVAAQVQAPQPGTPGSHSGGTAMGGASATHSSVSQETAITRVTQQLSLQQVGKHLRLTMPNGNGARPHPVDASQLITEAGAAYSVVDPTITQAANKLVATPTTTAEQLMDCSTADQDMRQHLHANMRHAIGPVTYDAWIRDSVTGTDGLQTMHALMSVATDIKPAAVDKKAVAFDDFSPLPVKGPGGLAEYFKVWKRQAKELQLLGKFGTSRADWERMYDSAYRLVSEHPQQALAVSTIWNAQKTTDPEGAVTDIYAYLKQEGDTQLARFDGKPQWNPPLQVTPQPQPPPQLIQPVPHAHSYNTRNSLAQQLMDEGKCIKFHTTGKCSYGSRCKFKHGEQGMANIAMALDIADVQEMMELTVMQDEMSSASMPQANAVLSQDDLRNAQLDRSDAQLQKLQDILQMIGCEPDGSSKPTEK